jgi:anti-anti-sigma factor
LFVAPNLYSGSDRSLAKVIAARGMGPGDTMTTLGERLAGSAGGQWPPLDVPAFEAARLREEQGHSVDLLLRNGSAVVRLAGDIDMVAAEDLSRLMQSLDRLTTAAVHVDLADVRFLDSSGLQPLIEATRRRRVVRLPPVIIGECSVAVLRLLHALGIDADPMLDVDAWDALAESFSRFAADPGVRESVVPAEHRSPSRRRE